MSLRINNNIQAMSALRNFGMTMHSISGSVERLSTGLRINSASDDPAGLIISESLRTHVIGINQATRNAQDAVNMTKTAEAALDEVQTLIRNMRGLAVHSANTATIDSVQLQANQAQIRNTIQSINRIAEQTQWGTKKLLDGTAGAIANVTQPEDVSSIFIGGSFRGESVANGPITVARVTSAERASIPLDVTYASATAIVTTSGNFVINGFSFSSEGNESLSTLVTKINNVSGSTGVVAEITGTGPVGVTLRSTDFGAAEIIDFFDPSGILNSDAAESDTGVNAEFDVTVTTSLGPLTQRFTGGQGQNVSGLLLTDPYGNSMKVTEQGNSGLSSATQIGVLTAGAVQFQIGAMSNQAIGFSMPTVYADRLGKGIVAGQDLSTIDVTTTQGANDAIRILDAAVQELAQARGNIGAFQNYFLESTMRSLEVAKENLSASESAIRDADMALEMTEFSRLQILQQSGLSMIAQANQLTEGVLSLLRN